MARSRRLDQIIVLIDGIDGAAIPALADLLLRRPDFDEFTELAM